MDVDGGGGAEGQWALLQGGPSLNRKCTMPINAWRTVVVFSENLKSRQHVSQVKR